MNRENGILACVTTGLLLWFIGIACDQVLVTAIGVTCTFSFVLVLVACVFQAGATLVARTYGKLRNRE